MHLLSTHTFYEVSNLDLQSFFWSILVSKSPRSHEVEAVSDGRLYENPSTKAEERMGGETSQALQKCAMRGTPRRYIKTTSSLRHLHLWAAVWSDRQDSYNYKKIWRSRLPKSLTSFAWRFRRSRNWWWVQLFPTQGHENLKAWELEILLIACLKLNDCILGLAGDKITFFVQSFIAFHIKLNTPTQHYCKDFYMGS